MTYEQFILAVQERVKEGVGEEVDITIYEAVKNNGTKHKGLTFAKRDVNLSPTVFLEPYYRQFLAGIGMDQIVEDIVCLYGELELESAWDGTFMKEYEEVKDRIVYRLVSRKANKELLEEIPYRGFLDLAVIFYVLVDVNDYGTASMLIRNEHLEIWGTSEEALFMEASRNTPRILGEDFQDMDSIIEEITGIHQDAGQSRIYVLTNRIRCNGAAVILNEGCLDRIGDVLGQNYYVLPSSIHEMIVVPESTGPDKQELSNMVKEINETQVVREEVLSDCAYYYDRTKSSLIV